MPYFEIKLDTPVWCNHCKANIFHPLAKAGKLYCPICNKEITPVGTMDAKPNGKGV